MSSAARGAARPRAIGLGVARVEGEDQAAGLPDGRRRRRRRGCRGDSRRAIRPGGSGPAREVARPASPIGSPDRASAMAWAIRASDRPASRAARAARARARLWRDVGAGVAHRPRSAHGVHHRLQPRRPSAVGALGQGGGAAARAGAGDRRRRTLERQRDAGCARRGRRGGAGAARPPNKAGDDLVDEPPASAGLSNSPSDQPQAARRWA